jgi:hypothetical protein
MLAEQLLQCESALLDDASNVFADVAEVPRFCRIPGDAGLSGWIALNEAVICSRFSQPTFGGGRVVA